MAIQFYQPKPTGLLHSRGLDVGLGAIEGGIGGAALGMAGANNPAIGRALGIGKKFNQDGTPPGGMDPLYADTEQALQPLSYTPNALNRRYTLMGGS